MSFITVIILTVTVICVSSEIDHGHLKQYSRIKRGRFSSGQPIRFYNPPPITFPIKGPFSYTPPPFMSDDEPTYPGRRPYKVSKRPTPPNNNGLGDDDITNLVKHLTKQDLDKILEFAQEKDQNFSKDRYPYGANEYGWPYNRESKIIYKENTLTKYEDPILESDQTKFVNYISEPTYIKDPTAPQRPKRPVRVYSDNMLNQWLSFDTVNGPPKQRPPYADSENLSHIQAYVNSQMPVNFSTLGNPEFEPSHVKLYTAQEFLEQPAQVESNLPKDVSKTSNSPVNFLDSDSKYFTESNEEDKLPRPVNMRPEDYYGSYTNNVPKVVKAESSSYDIENFGNLPLMDYNSKLHDVSSYHVPHYTVTQSKPSKPSPSASLTSSPYGSPSLSLLKPSPAAAAIKEPVYEPAPPVSAAKQQSDAHLQATKIWSHKSKGAAYTLHDDGTLSPERSRPKYG